MKYPISNIIKIAPMHRLIKRAGAERVSKESAEMLGEILEELDLNIAKTAIDFAEHPGRKTVKKRDIEIAMEKTLKTRAPLEAVIENIESE